MLLSARYICIDADTLPAQIAQQTALTTGATTRMIDRREQGGFAEAAETPPTAVRSSSRYARLPSTMRSACPGARTAPHARSVPAIHRPGSPGCLSTTSPTPAPALLAAVDDLRDRAAQREGLARSLACGKPRRSTIPATEAGARRRGPGRRGAGRRHGKAPRPAAASPDQLGRGWLGLYLHIRIT